MEYKTEDFFDIHLKNGTHEKLNNDNNFDPLCLKEINGIIYARSGVGIFLKQKDDVHFIKDKLENNHDPIYPTVVNSICEDRNGRHSILDHFPDLLYREKGVMQTGFNTCIRKQKF